MSNENWNNNELQFPRVIEEARAAGAFTHDVFSAMTTSMDISREDLHELLDRATSLWDGIKAGRVLPPVIRCNWNRADVQDLAEDAMGLELTDAQTQKFLDATYKQIRDELIRHGNELLLDFLRDWSRKSK